MFTKADEIEAEEEVKKDNKLSAYRKLPYKDDEIREIRPNTISSITINHKFKES